MKILLAPSETKIAGGEGKFDIDSLFLPEINSKRVELINTYTKIVLSQDLEILSKMFGLKKESDIKKHIKDITKEATMKAILRYKGVAFDYLDYPTLTKDAQEYLDNNLLIFSNLFGILKASDKIPEYRLKQGEAVGNIKPEKVYKELLKEPLDRYLENEDILDIRAAFYDKFYKANKSYTTLKFLKNGKVVSHWAKAYRGLVLRHCAINRVDSIKEFMSLNIPKLSIIEIREQGKKQEVVYEINE